MPDPGMPREDHIIQAIERARDNAASYWATCEIDGATEEERGRWIDILYDTLRADLLPEDRVRAIVILISAESKLRAQVLTRGANAGDLL